MNRPSRSERGVWSSLFLRGPVVEPCRDCPCEGRPSPLPWVQLRAAPSRWNLLTEAAAGAPERAGRPRRCCVPAAVRTPAEPGASSCERRVVLGWGAPFRRRANFHTAPAKCSRQCPLPSGVALTPRCRNRPGVWGKPGSLPQSVRAPSRNRTWDNKRRETSPVVSDPTRENSTPPPEDGGMETRVPYPGRWVGGH